MTAELTQAPHDSDIHTALVRTIVVANDKGGVGKTSITANLAGLYAAAGYKVLALDINRQANLADDLGYRGSDIDDQGCGLLGSIQHTLTITPVAVPGRDNLDVVPGGVALTDLTAIVMTRLQTQGSTALLALGRVLAPIADRYDLILIDTPPENPTLVDLALRAGRWLLMPTKSDKGGLVGMQLLAERFTAAREQNPNLGLMGVVLFGTNRAAKAIHRTVRSEIDKAFGLDQSSVLTTAIGHSEGIAQDSRNRGRVAHELESDAASQPKWWESLRAGNRMPGQRISPTATNVAEDYRKLASEILDILSTAEGSTAGEAA